MKKLCMSITFALLLLVGCWIPSSQAPTLRVLTNEDNSLVTLDTGLLVLSRSEGIELRRLWKKLPITVYTRDRDAAKATKLFNRWAMREFFKLTKNRSRANVEIIVEDSYSLRRANSTNILGTVSLYQRKNLVEQNIQAKVYVAGKQSLPRFGMTVMHSLGHLLGLADNDYEGTLMFHPVDRRGIWDFHNAEASVPTRMCDATRSFLRSF